MGVCGNHWKRLQLRSCKICCKSVKQKHLFRDQMTFLIFLKKCCGGSRRWEPPRWGHRTVWFSEFPVSWFPTFWEKKTTRHTFQCPDIWLFEFRIFELPILECQVSDVRCFNVPKTEFTIARVLNFQFLDSDVRMPEFRNCMLRISSVRVSDSRVSNLRISIFDLSMFTNLPTLRSSNFRLT